MKTDPSPSNRRRRSVARRLIIGAAVSATLSACTTSQIPHDAVATVPDDYRVAHPILIDERLQTMDIPVGIDAGLSTTARGSVAGFAQRFKASRSDVMAIVVPNGSPNEPNALRISHLVQDVLVEAGVPPSAIDVRRYSAGPKETGAPIRLAYSKIAAHVEGCGAWSGDLGHDPRNRNYGNFGCATQANLAAMVDNPLDLVYPREMTPPDAGRRYTVLDLYRQGEIHATKQGVLSSNVSDAVASQ
jgi:pilus assembly protein CpaD